MLTLTACNSEQKKQKEHDEHDEHEVEGVVFLNANQREALNLKLGDFQMRNLTTMVKSNGQLEVAPGSSADITAVVGGNVKSIKVFHGDKVSRGQVLAVLEHPDYIVLQEDFAEVASKLDFLEKEYERQKELFENNVGSGKDYQKTKSEYNTTKAKYAGLKLRLQMLNISPEKVQKGEITNTITIKSPIKGFVNEVNIKVGSYVGEKDVLFEVTDNDAIHADFMVYEQDVHLIKEGQKVHFTVSNRPDKEYTATIFAIGKEFDKNNRAVHIHAKVNEDTDGLISGMYISGHIHTDKNYTRTLPNDAIVSEGTKSFIFIVDNELLEENKHNEHEGHNHELENTHEEVADDGHDHKENTSEINNENNKMAFRMVEIITGLKEEGYTEVKLIDSLPKNTKVVLNAAYYLLADMKKEETEHEH